MPPSLQNLLGKCFPCVRRRPAARMIHPDVLEASDGPSFDNFFFVIPPEDFPRFEARRPLHGIELNIGEFMFFYQYFIPKQDVKPSNVDSKYELYFFLDGESFFALEGWVPSKKGYQQYLDRLKAEVTIGFEAKSSQPSTSQSLLKSEVESKFGVSNDGKQAVKIEKSLSPRKSSYTSGGAATWSRHLNPTNSQDSHDSDTHPGSHIFKYSDKSMDRLNKDIYAVIEGCPLGSAVATGSSRAHGMIRSTIDTRDTRIRPRAAKGPRKQPDVNGRCQLFQ